MAIVATHPIQYYAPWFRWMAAQFPVPLRVFYLDRPDARGGYDQEFGQAVQWDTPLTEGYPMEWVPNLARDPGAHHYAGLNNPDLWPRVARFRPALTLLLGYRYRSLLPALLLRRLPGPTVLRGDSHLLDRQRSLGRWLSDRVVRRAFSSLGGALYVGRHSRAYFRHHGLPADRLFASPAAVDLNHFSALERVQQAAAELRLKWRIPPDHRVVLFVGKLVPRKEPALLTRAFLAANLANTSLVFAGTGELSGEIASIAGGADSVRIVGFHNQSLMPAVYRTADLLVLPSTIETWGLAVNEAFAVGVPALVSDSVGCAADLIEGRDTGRIFPAGNETALRDQLSELLSQPDRLRRWGDNARLLVHEHFNYAAMTDGVTAAFKTLSEGALSDAG
ncbi:MAG: glycosyltransferase family 4 protein [Pseudomonadota bacterium]